MPITKALALVIAIVLGDITAPTRAAPAEAQDAAAPAVAALRKAAQPGNGITDEERQAAAKVVAVGAAALPGLLALLRDEDREVRTLAAYTLSDMPGLTAQHLDALIESQRRDDSWLLPAIAEIGTPQAVTFLVEMLVRDRDAGFSSLPGAIQDLGKKAVPELLRQVYQEDPRWDAQLEQTMTSVFFLLGADSAAAIDPLLKIATDEAAPLPRRLHAIKAVAATRQAAEKIVPAMQALMRQTTAHAELRWAARMAIITLGTAEAVPLMVQDLQEAKEARDRRDHLGHIAGLHTRARSAGPVVARYLHDADWDVRVAAAGAVGDIGHVGAADALIQLLAHEEDWRLVFRAARSLGTLRSKAALPALAQVAQGHWYPPVRQAAQAAIKAVKAENGAASEATRSDPNDALNNGPFGYERAGAELETLEEADADRLRLPLDAAQHAPVPLQVQAKDGTVTTEQARAVKVPGGHLVGVDRGEFGGEILLIDPQGLQHVIAHANTEALYQTSAGLVAVTGLAHMWANDGALFKLIPAPEGRWTLTKWRILPGAPDFSRLLQDGRLLINCHSSGTVLVTPEGKMTLLTRAEALRPETPRK